MLSYGSDHVLKLMKDYDRGFREVFFYEALRSVIDKTHIRVLVNDVRIQRNARLLRALTPFTPNYYGITSDVSSTENNVSPTSIILSNLTAGYQKPCVLDIKMGQNTYEPDATPAKKESQENKYPEQRIFGFRVVGMNVYDPSHAESNQDGFRTFDKNFGRQLRSSHDIQNALSVYFNLQIGNDKKRTNLLIQNLVQQLEMLRMHLTDCNDGIAFIASSILIIYEGDAVCTPEDFTVKMIDFAHVRYSRGGDLSYIYGLDTIITMLKSIL